MSVYATNKRARHDYAILEAKEAGLVLSGQEVKAIRNRQAQLKGAYVSVTENAAYLKHAHIAPYRYASVPEQYHPERDRKLLLNKKELAYLRAKSQTAGLTIVPLSLYTKGPYIKLEIGIAKGKKKYDKRQALKRRDQEREMKRARTQKNASWG